MNNEDFEKIVSKAIDNIPEPYDSKIAEINFVVENKTTPEQRKKLGLRKCDALFGLYEGVPLPSRNGAVFSKVPDVITIFMHPMIDMFPDKQALTKQIYETVWHEVAHFYGLNHDRIHKITSSIKA